MFPVFKTQEHHNDLELETIPAFQTEGHNAFDETAGHWAAVSPNKRDSGPVSALVGQSAVTVSERSVVSSLSIMEFFN